MPLGDPLLFLLIVYILPPLLPAAILILSLLFFLFISHSLCSPSSPSSLPHPPLVVLLCTAWLLIITHSLFLWLIGLLEWDRGRMVARQPQSWFPLFASFFHTCECVSFVWFKRKTCSSGGNAWRQQRQVFRVWVLQWTQRSETRENLQCKDFKNHLLLCVDVTKTTKLQQIKTQSLLAILKKTQLWFQPEGEKQTQRREFKLDQCDLLCLLTVFDLFYILMSRGKPPQPAREDAQGRFQRGSSRSII